MFRFTTPFLVAVAAIGAVSGALAGPIVRGASFFETLPIEGVSLSTPPREAFDILRADGYTAGEVTRYEDWTEGSLNLVRGVFGGPEGQSSITLGRADGRLVLISQSLNRRGIDAADETDCRMNSAGTSGACAARDAEEPAAATMKFTMTAQSMMILRSVSRPKDLKKTLE